MCNASDRSSTMPSYKPRTTQNAPQISRENYHRETSMKLARKTGGHSTLGKEIQQKMGFPFKEAGGGTFRWLVYLGVGATDVIQERQQ